VQWILDNWPTVLGGGVAKAAAGASYRFLMSLVNSGGTVTLVNDADTPGANKMYGTDGAGAKGWQDAPAGGVPVDTLTDGSKLAEVEYSTSTHVLRYRSPTITVVDGVITKIGPMSDWVTIDTAVAET
jgi:hypothetical protein